MREAYHTYVRVIFAGHVARCVGRICTARSEILSRPQSRVTAGYCQIYLSLFACPSRRCHTVSCVKSSLPRLKARGVYKLARRCLGKTKMLGVKAFRLWGLGCRPRPPFMYV